MTTAVYAGIALAQANKCVLQHYFSGFCSENGFLKPKTLITKGSQEFYTNSYFKPV